jgi:hypothetical protein
MLGSRARGRPEVGRFPTARRAIAKLLYFWAVGAGLFTGAAIALTALTDPRPTMLLGALALLPGLSVLVWFALGPLRANKPRRPSYY